MNIANIDKLIELISNVPPHQIMMQWFHRRSSCGTTHCLAGWTASLVPLSEWPNDTERTATNYLDLDRQQAHELFFMYEAATSMGQFDAHLAAVRQLAALKVLRGLKATGRVDWDAAIVAAVEEQ